MPIWIFQQARESGPNGQSVRVVGYDETATEHRPNMTKNVEANLLKQELHGHRENASGRLKSANS